MTALARNIARLLRSPRLAYLMLLLLTLATAAGVLTPYALLDGDMRYQRFLLQYPAFARMLEWTGIENYYNTYWYQSLVAILFLNTLFCTWEQWKKARLEVLRGNTVSSGTPATAPLVSRSVSVMKRYGYRVSIEENQRTTILRARRGSWGLFGSPLFHSFLLVIIAGVILSGLTRFAGYLLLAEGEALPHRPESYETVRHGPLSTSTDASLLIELEALDVAYDSGGFPYLFSSRLRLARPSTAAEIITVTLVKPTPYAGFNFYQLDRGFSPLLLFFDNEGHQIWGAFLYLETIPGPNGQIYQDLAFIAPLGERVNIELLPDGKERLPATGPWLHLPEAPVLVLTLAGEAVRVPLGETAEFAGYSVSFPELRNWSGMNVVRDPGYYLIFAGFAGALFSLILLYFCSYHRLEAAIESGVVSVQEIRRREKIMPLPTVSFLEEQLREALQSGGESSGSL